MRARGGRGARRRRGDSLFLGLFYVLEAFSWFLGGGGRRCPPRPLMEAVSLITC